MIIPVVKTYPSEAGAYSINNGLQILGGYGFCSDFILQLYYRDIRISSIYEGTTGIQSQDLWEEKMTMGHGEGAQLLMAEMMETIQAASQLDSLKGYAKILGDKLQVTQQILGHLMPFAMKGDYERFLADASIFMEFFSLVIMGWTWLDIGVNAQQSLITGNGNYADEFYESKLETLEYFFAYELPKTAGHAEILMHPTTVTIKKKKNISFKMNLSPKVHVVLLWGSVLLLWFAFDLFMVNVVFEFLRWNGTTKNDWFFMLWWGVVGLWSLYCLRRLLKTKVN